MAKQIKSKTRTTAKKQGFQFKWWMGAGLVALVAVIGVIVVRYSNAAEAGLVYDVAVGGLINTDTWSATRYTQGVALTGTLKATYLVGDNTKVGQWVLDTDFPQCGMLQTAQFKNVTTKTPAPGYYKFTTQTCPKG